MKVGDLVKILWTDGLDEVPTIFGIVLQFKENGGVEPRNLQYNRMRVQMLPQTDTRPLWIDKADLRVVNESR